MNLLVILNLSLIGCYTPHPHPDLCDSRELPLGLEEPSNLGFTAAELLSDFEGSRSRWEVAWREPAGAPPQTLEITVDEVDGAREVRFDRAVPELCPALDRVALDLQIAVASTDGEVVATGPAVLWAEALGEPFANLEFELEATVAPATEAVVLGEIPATATLDSVMLGSNIGSVGIDARWTRADGDGTTVVYDCDYIGAANPEVTDCLEMGAPLPE